MELSEYHWFHREKVELFMAELYNKIGVGLMTWSPISFGFSFGEKEENFQLFEKLSIKNHKAQKVEHVVVPITQLPNPGPNPGPIPNIAPATVRITDGTGKRLIFREFQARTRQNLITKEIS